MDNRNYMKSYCELQLEYKTSLIELKALSEMITAYSANPEKHKQEVEDTKSKYESKQIITDVYKTNLKRWNEK